MLVILYGSPVSSPGKSIFVKQFVAVIRVIDLMPEGPAAVCIFLSVGRLADTASVDLVNVRIVARINVDCQSITVFGQFCGSAHCAEIKR